MTRAGFEYILDKHVRTAWKTCASPRDRSASPHQLRHSCAVIMLQATRDFGNRPDGRLGVDVEGADLAGLAAVLAAVKVPI